MFRIRTEDEIRKKQARRRKREREKKKEKETVTGAESNEIADEDDVKLDDVALTDLFTPHLVVRANAKIRSFDFGTREMGPHKTSDQVGFYTATMSVETQAFSDLPCS